MANTDGIAMYPPLDIDAVVSEPTITLGRTIIRDGAVDVPAKVTNVPPLATDFGLVVRIGGGQASVSNSVTNPGANAEIVSMDTTNLAHKSIFMTSTVATTLRIQVSSDAVMFRTVEDVVLSAGAEVFASGRAQEIMRGWRYVRVINVPAVVGTVTVEIAAQM